MKIFDIKKLNVKYNEHYALKKINLSIKPNEYVCLVGKNGSGKSTLLKVIAGLIKKDSGTIDIYANKGDIAYLAQNNMRDINFPATAKEIIMTGCQKHGEKLFYSKTDEEALEKISEKLNIKKLLNKKIGDLSGGERQRILLARTLIGNPKILLLDEPCSGFDAQSIRTFYKILDDLYSNTDITIIMATHDLDEISNTNVRVIALDQEIVFDGNINDYKKQME